jgi:DNA-binding NarL/FixJ family response regulator
MTAMLTRKKSVIVVEDDVRLQQQLIKILDAAGDITCLAAVSSAEEALEKIPRSQPDVVLMDINLPGISGIDCIRELKKKLPRLEVVMLTAYEEEDNIFRALKEGASGYLLKSSTPGDICNAIRDVYSGGAPFSSHIARKVAQYFRVEREIEDDNEKLAPREKEVLKLLASGYIYKEVADQLDLTLETVRTYVKRIRQKLHVRSKVEAIIKYRA